jgi:hypothetical protein
MGKACNMHESGHNFVQNFGCNTLRKEQDAKVLAGFI